MSNPSPQPAILLVEDDSQLFNEPVSSALKKVNDLSAENDNNNKANSSGRAVNKSNA
ncbi:hypothetical protein MNBD_GAMMA07-902 [hydrothermal vent metagenome]|uniref:Uncharacterized protein n=1 Tax=hydrothermal vent metagenome TaxID=652676 RepID=A0A3B0WP94_9ZZZZ